MHSWSTAKDGSKLLGRDRQGKTGGGVALCVRKGLNCLELNNDDNRVECLWVRIRSTANKAGILVEVCYRAPSQDGEADEIFWKQLGQVLQSLALIVLADFSISEVC